MSMQEEKCLVSIFWRACVVTKLGVGIPVRFELLIGYSRLINICDKVINVCIYHNQSCLFIYIYKT